MDSDDSARRRIFCVWVFSGAGELYFKEKDRNGLPLEEQVKDEVKV